MPRCRIIPDMNTYGNILTEDGEQIHYLDENLPYYITRTNGRKPSTKGIMHWHHDIEISFVVRGTLRLIVAGEEIEAQQSDGILINSCQIHQGISSEDVDFICLRFHPMLLCINEYIETSYINPIIHNRSFGGMSLSRQVDWQKQILDLLLSLFDATLDKKEGMPLLIEQHLFEIWRILFANLPKASNGKYLQSQQMSILKEMIGHIQEHYGEKVTLHDIADSGNVSISTANAIFNKHVHMSPIGYLLAYRMHHAQSLLHNTTLPISKICRQCGFTSLSYFTGHFRRQFGITPSAFRKQFKQ